MVDAEKKQLRAHARARRRGLVFDRAAPERAALRFLSSLPADKVFTVSLYWPMAEELDVKPLMHHLALAGHGLALPVVVAKESPLVFRAYKPGDPLIAAGFGTHEPAPAAAEVEPDVFVVPLLAFDATGHRLGYGGGFYDRTLTAARQSRAILAVGYGFEGQKVGRLPRHGGDAVLDAVVTDHQVHWFNKREMT